MTTTNGPTEMLFWILVALSIAVGAYTWIRAGRDSFNETFGRWMLAGLSTLVTAALAALAFLIVAANSGSERVIKSEVNVTLKSLGTNSAVKGRFFFLGGGYVNEKRVLNYISTEDGGIIRVKQAEADKSTILEDSPEQPYVRVQHYDIVNNWVMTWPSRDDYAYEFHIHAGSVLNDYTLDNK